MLQTWEEAIKYCKELADQYEKETFQYIELGQILVSLSETLYTSYKYVRFTDIFTYIGIVQNLNILSISLNFKTKLFRSP